MASGRGTNSGKPKKGPVEMKATDFNLSATTFAEIVGTRTYVDKSLFIKAVLQHVHYHLITAPRRFGKSINLNMLKHFVETEVDEEGKPKVTGQVNRKLFDRKLHDGTALKIMGEMEIVNKHFGQYPVIFVDFKCDSDINSYDHAVEWCQSAVQEAFIAHEYLVSSPKLKDREKRVCDMWINNKSIKRADISKGLKVLSIFLYKHYGGKRVFLLVDEYDAIITKALFRVDKDTLGCIAEFSTGILSAVLKSSAEVGITKHVAGAVITGISYITGAGVSCLNNIVSDPFLRNTQFLKYYGLTKDEVDNLLERFDSTENEITNEELRDHYNGYVSENRKVSIYPLWSVLNCLFRQKTGKFYEETGTITKFAEVFQIPVIRSKVEHLVLGASVCVKINRKVSNDDLTRLRSLILEPNEYEERYLQEFDDVQADIFFSFLFEQGYLTFDQEEESEQLMDTEEKLYSIVAPNEEIKDTLREKLIECYTVFCKFKTPHRKNCRKSFNNLIECVKNPDANFESAEKELLKHLQDLLETALSQRTCLKLNEAALHAGVFFVFLNSDFQYTSEYILPNKKRLDLAAVKDDCGIILEFKYDNGQSRGTTASDALNQIKTNEYSQVFKDKKLFPNRRINNVVLIGISINDAKKVSIKCERGGKKETTPKPQRRNKRKR